jgi:SEC-C motif
MEWYEAMRSRWRAEQELAQRLLEEVEAGIDHQGRVFLLGTIRILSRHGHEYTTCKIRIVYPQGFPERGRVPAVYLESHQNWCKGPDTHIEEDWKLCLFVPGEAGIDFSSPDSLGELIQYLRVFLFKEYLYQGDLISGLLIGTLAVWPGQARSHGIVGIHEAVRERGGWGRNEPCPCGSGKKYKRCCLPKMRQI